MHYYQFNIGDYVSHTRHLTPIEDISYRRLLDAYYLAEKPLVGDFKAIARQIGMRDHEDDVSAILSEFFQETEEGWRNTRADKEIEHYRAKQEQASRAGKASAERRINARSTDVQPNINQEPITKKHSSVTNVTEAKPQLTPDEIIFGYGVPLLTNAGTAEKQARSFLGGLRKSHGDDALIDALRECLKAKPLQPLEWLAKVLPPKGAPPKQNKQEALEASNRAVAERLLRKEGLL